MTCRKELSICVYRRVGDEGGKGDARESKATKDRDHG